MRDYKASTQVLRRKSRILLFSLLLWLACPQRALAYLDPGTGSYVLQLIIAFFVGILYTSKIVRRRIFGFIRSLFSRKKRVQGPDQG
jgi:hypothetical protein